MIRKTQKFRSVAAAAIGIAPWPRTRQDGVIAHHRMPEAV